MIAEDCELDPGACVGTLRWKTGKRFPSVDSLGVEDARAQGEEIDLSKGWVGYLVSRCKSMEAIAKSQSDLAIIDGLSFAITLAFALREMGINSKSLKKWGKKKLNLVVVGATYKAELRILRETKYWDELARCLGVEVDCELWFVGPEAAQDGGKSRIKEENVFCGGCKTFFEREHPELVDMNSESLTVLVGYNPGFGSGSEELLRSWIDDLVFIIDSNLPCIFTQANDYSDLRGELLVLRNLLKVNFVLAPKKNPFHMALTACEDQSNPTASTWSCGNTFLYAFQGGRERGGAEMFQKVGVTCRLLQSFYQSVQGFSISDVKLNQDEVKASIHIPDTHNPLVVKEPSVQAVKGNIWALD